MDTVMRTRMSFFIDPELNAALEQLQERDGVPKAESIRRALAAYLEEKGIAVKPQKGGKTTKKK